MEEILNPIQGSNEKSLIGIGERLRTARKSLRLSEKEAASRLNLNTSLIDLMENENFHKGPPATFMRGYLRSYGRLLNFNDNEINLAINELNLSLPQNTSAPTSLQKKEEKSQLDRYLRWSSYLVISLLLGLVIVWWSSHPRYNEAEILSKPEIASTETSLAAPDTIIAPVTPETKPENKAIETPAVLDGKSTATTAPPATTPEIQNLTPAPVPSSTKPIHVTSTHDAAAENVNDVDDDTPGENVY